MENRTIYKVTFFKYNDEGYIYKEAYNILTEKSVKKLNITVVSEMSVTQGRITDYLEDSIYLANVINQSNKRDLTELATRLVRRSAYSEQQQLSMNIEADKWIMSQKSCNHRGSEGLMNIIANKFCK